MINIYHSRRGHFKKCRYWLRNEENYIGDLSKWVIDKKVSGCFYAKPVSESSTNSSQLSNVMMFDQDSMTLETGDNIESIKRGAVVEYLGKYWIVDTIQRQIILKENQYQDEYIYYIRIRK